jgi:hypothetical protein
MGSASLNGNAEIIGGRAKRLWSFRRRFSNDQIETIQIETIQAGTVVFI